MKWLFDNWSLLVVILAVVFVAYRYFKKFSELPNEEQLIKIREWLLYAVIQAEKEYGGGTGNLKLRATYAWFCEIFPSFVTVIPFDLFSKMVDGALEQMKHLLESNPAIKNYVNGGKEQ